MEGIGQAFLYMIVGAHSFLFEQIDMWFVVPWEGAPQISACFLIFVLFFRNMIKHDQAILNRDALMCVIARGRSRFSGEDARFFDVNVEST